jgi:23S rRNA (adenine2503-C2)-methyltransferase
MTIEGEKLLDISSKRKAKEKTKDSIYALNSELLKEWLIAKGEKPFRAKQFIDQLFDKRAPLEEVTTLPKVLVDDLVKDFAYALEIEKQVTSKDKTKKWLFKLNDGLFIETVLMEYAGRATVCVSSQAGCAMGCTFCATGQAGFDRHLNVGEILEQVARACHSTSSRISNIVFMGMGEPLANVDVVYEACKRLTKDWGFSARHITVSTVGVVPGMKKMAKWELPVTLAISLHSPYDDKRSEMIPLNKRYDIAEVLKAGEDVSHAHGRRVSFEYCAIDDKNINDKTGHELGNLLRDFNGAGGAHVNIIPLNQTSGFKGKASRHSEIQRFAEIVEKYGVTVSIRKNRGSDIDAACGQLRERETSK